MKNEGDHTISKKKNEDFFKELHKDRIQKNCEYAVLVSLLEIDSELYNSGIVDVSHKYEKTHALKVMIPKENKHQKKSLVQRAIKKHLHP